MRRVLTVVCFVSLAGVLGCGPSAQEQQVEAAQKAAAEAQKTAADSAKTSADAMASGLAGMARGLQGLTGGGGGDPNQKPVDPVSFHDLQTVFGDFSGWDRGKPTGEQMSTPVNYSEAKVTYRKGDAQIEAQISDSGFNQMLLLPFTMFLTNGYEKETEDGYEKSMKVGDYPGWEKWNSTSKSGELNVIVDKRFIVQTQGQHLDDPKTMHDAMASLDLTKLASLK